MTQSLSPTESGFHGDTKPKVGITESHLNLEDRFPFKTE